MSSVPIHIYRSWWDKAIDREAHFTQREFDEERAAVRESLLREIASQGRLQMEDVA